MANIPSTLRAFSSKCGKAFDAFAAALAFAFLGTAKFVIVFLICTFLIKDRDFINVPIWGVPLLFPSLFGFHWYVHRTQQMTFPQFWAGHPYLDKVVTAAAKAVVIVLASIILMFLLQQYGLVAK